MKDSKQEIADLSIDTRLHINKNLLVNGYNKIGKHYTAAVDMLAACLYHLRESGQPVNLDALYQIHVELEKMRSEEAESTK